MRKLSPLTVRIYTNIAVSSCSGSGPAYTINYGSSVANVQVGDIVTVYKMAVGEGAHSGSDEESKYTYRVTGITDSDTLTMTYVTDTNGDRFSVLQTIICGVIPILLSS
jgi:hypothetical protein